MKFVGVDLHKKTITLCVVAVVDGKRRIVTRRRFMCCEIAKIREFFLGLGQFQVVVEATASYEWFFQLIEDQADRCVLAHPKKLRIIAESKHKTDRIDARVLAEFLAIDMIPEAYRPSPRVQQYRRLVRLRQWLQGRITAAKCKLHQLAADYNQDIEKLFSSEGRKHLADIAMNHADRFTVQMLQEQLNLSEQQLREVDAELRRFAQSAHASEREARAVLQSFPQIGVVTIDVLLSELGDWRRFRSAKRMVSYAGLDPGQRDSDGKTKQLKITKDGSRLMRWVLIETAWRLVRKYQRWKAVFENLIRNTGSKKRAIVAVARRVLCVIHAMLREGKAYQYPKAA